MLNSANIRMTDTFQKDRVFLSGDAGHAHSPAGGQGLNSSIQDSVSTFLKPSSMSVADNNCNCKVQSCLEAGSRRERIFESFFVEDLY